MRSPLQTRPSTYLIILAVIILSLGFIMAYYIHSTVENLKYDAGIINKTGMIRGSIQRVAKLALSDTTYMYRHVIMDINELFELFLSSEEEYRQNGPEDDLINGILDLKHDWHILEHELLRYQNTHSEMLRLAIIEESEECWAAADQIVMTAQLATEEKVGGIKLFYNILLLNALIAVVVILYVLLYVRKRLEYESSHDPLTGLYNRRTFEGVLESEIARSVRYRSALSLVLLDIDHFKKVNDKYGHRTGDKVLVSLAHIIQEAVRRTDSVYRIGGEEFAIICPETSAEGAYRLAEKVRGKIKQAEFVTKSVETVSQGVAEHSKDITKEELHHNADQAMYLAKNRGRDRTEIYSGSD